MIQGTLYLKIKVLLEQHVGKIFHEKDTGDRRIILTRGELYSILWDVVDESLTLHREDVMIAMRHALLDIKKQSRSVEEKDG